MVPTEKPGGAEQRQRSQEAEPFSYFLHLITLQKCLLPKIAMFNEHQVMILGARHVNEIYKDGVVHSSV